MDRFFCCDGNMKGAELFERQTNQVKARTRIKERLRGYRAKIILICDPRSYLYYNLFLIKTQLKNKKSYSFLSRLVTLYRN